MSKLIIRTRHFPGGERDPDTAGDLLGDFDCVSLIARVKRICPSGLPYGDDEASGIFFCPQRKLCRGGLGLPAPNLTGRPGSLKER